MMMGLLAFLVGVLVVGCGLRKVLLGMAVFRDEAPDKTEASPPTDEASVQSALLFAAKVLLLGDDLAMMAAVAAAVAGAAVFDDDTTMAFREEGENFGLVEVEAVAKVIVNPEKAYLLLADCLGYVV